MAVNESLYAKKIHVDLKSYHYLLGRGYSTIKIGWGGHVFFGKISNSFLGRWTFFLSCSREKLTLLISKSFLHHISGHPVPQ